MNKGLKEMQNNNKRGYYLILQPIFQQPILFLSLFWLLGFRTLQFVYGFVMGHDTDSTHNMFMFLCQLSLLFLLSYFLCLSVVITKSRFIKNLIYFLASLLFVIERFIYSGFSMSGISPNILLLIAETNVTEGTDFLSTFLFTPAAIKCYIFLVVMVSLIAFLEYHYKRIINSISTILQMGGAMRIIALGVMICLSLSVYSLSSFVNLFSCKGTDDVGSWRLNDKIRPIDTISNIVYSYVHLHMASKEMETAVATSEKAFVRQLSIKQNNRDSLTVVCVIGESFIKHHSNLYGYSLETCPNMQSEEENGNLIAYTNVVSPFAGTSRVIRNVLCCNNVTMEEKWYDKPFFPSLFKASGYSVYMFDNQKSDDPNSSYGFTLNSFLYNKKLTKISYDYVNPTPCKYDGNFICEYKSQCMKHDNPKNLIIVHLMGQHMKASSQYPHTKQFTRFTTNEIKRKESWMNDDIKQEIAHYDNATYYNDYVLSLLFDMYRDRNSIIVYFSDHGEEIYDWRNSMGRVDQDEPNKNVIKYQYEVPFFVWCSNKYIANNHTKYLNIIKSKGKPFSIDNVAHFLFDVADVNTPYYVNKYNPLSDSYKCEKRYVGVSKNIYENFYPLK